MERRKPQTSPSRDVWIHWDRPGWVVAPGNARAALRSGSRWRSSKVRRRANHGRASATGPESCHCCQWTRMAGKTTKIHCPASPQLVVVLIPSPIPKNRVSLSSTLSVLQGLGSNLCHSSVGVEPWIFILIMPAVEGRTPFGGRFALDCPAPTGSARTPPTLSWCSSNTAPTATRPSTKLRSCFNSPSSVAAVDAIRCAFSASFLHVVLPHTPWRRARLAV